MEKGKKDSRGGKGKRRREPFAPDGGEVMQPQSSNIGQTERRSSHVSLLNGKRGRRKSEKYEEKGVLGTIRYPQRKLPLEKRVAGQAGIGGKKRTLDTAPDHLHAGGGGPFSARNLQSRAAIATYAQ